MKKIICVFFVVIMVFLFGCECSFSSDIFNKEKEITVFVDENKYQYTAIVDKEFSIRPVTKEGYYLKGFYSEKEGGQKYIKADGNSLSVWKDEFPTTLYAQFESINELMFKGDVILDTVQIRDEFSPQKKYVTYNLSEDFNNAILANYNSNIYVSVSFYVKGEAKGMGIANGRDPQSIKILIENGEEDVNFVRVPVSKERTQQTCIITCPAVKFLDASIMVSFVNDTYMSIIFVDSIEIKYAFNEEKV